jgi:N-acyl-L-homoserine lactone synthetase
MIHMITAENRHIFRHALMEMHRQRKSVFIDELKWRLEETAGVEIDAYDSAEAVYLIEAEGARAAVTGSARLLPTDRPHLLGDIFPHLCTEAPPRGANIWEATRFCPAPDTPKGAPRRDLLARMIAAIMEAALLFGIERVTFVANAGLAPLALNAGWNARALGPPQLRGRDRLTAIVADISAEGLRQVRIRGGIGAPLTRFAAGGIAQAA